MPIGRSSNDTMFQGSPFNLTAFSDDCKRAFGVIPRPHWITTEFGGHVSFSQTWAPFSNFITHRHLSLF